MSKNLKNKVSKAFSLTEISLVLIIISLLVSAIFTGGDLIDEANRTAAQRVSNRLTALFHEYEVSLHLDAVNKESVEIITQNGKDRVTKWEDVKTSGVKHEFAQSNVDRMPIYIKDGINGRPGVYFDNYSTGTTYLHDSQIYGRDLFGAGNKMTFFIVQYLPDPDTNLTRIFNWYKVYGAYAHRIIITTGSNISHNFGNFCCYGNSTQNATFPPESISKPAVITLTKNGCAMSVNVNGVNIDNESRCYGNTLTNWAPTDLGGYFKGYVGEILVFKESLDASSISKFENLLMKKWKIK